MSYSTVSALAGVLNPPDNNASSLFTSNNINIWSKWKPVNYNTFSKLTESQLASVSYGITVPSYTSLSSLIAFYTNGTRYTYTRPYNTSSSPYRLGDFSEYNHSALPPISSISSVSNVLDTASSFSVSLNASVTDSSMLSFANLGLGNYYLGIVVVASDGNYRVYSSSLTVNNIIGNGNGLSFSVANFSTTSSYYKVYPFITPTQSITEATSFSGTLYPMDSVSSITINIVTSYEVNIDNVENIDLGIISYDVTLSNNTSSSVTFTYCIVEVAQVGTSFNQYDTPSGGARTVLGNIAVGANSSYTVSGQLNVSETLGEAIFYFYVQSPSFLKSRAVK